MKSQLPPRDKSPAFRDGLWIKCSPILREMVGKEAAFLICYLANKEALNSAGNQLSKDRFMECKVEELVEEAQMDRNMQQRALNELIEREFITMKKTGTPARRFVRLEWSEIDFEVSLALKKKAHRKVKKRRRKNIK